MKSPKRFKINPKRGYSQCIACDRWRIGNNIFFHEGRQWNLCRVDYVDYWENTNKLLPDYKGYNV